jgi:hypothetical protein
MSPIRFAISIFAGTLLCVGPGFAQTGFPFQNETLRYSLNWPSGLSLGEAAMTARRTESGWSLDVSLDAGVPGFSIKDRYKSTVESADLCSTFLERDISHGNKRSSERTTFNQRKRTAHRTTILPPGGGESDFDIPVCGRDALAFVYFVRREMGQGRVAPAQTVFFGSAYSIKMDYTGARNIRVGDKMEVTDHLLISGKGPKSEFSVEVHFARDAARTPLSIKIPVTVGTLSLDLVR